MKKLIVVVVVLLFLVGVGWIFRRDGEDIPGDEVTDNPVPIQNIGVNIDYFDPETGKAGDFVFTKGELHDDIIFVDYGYFIPANSMGPDKYNPQPTYILPMGTEVFSLIDGIVVDIPKLYSDDYSVMVAPREGSRWAYELEHVTGVVVEVGDVVKAGQVVAEVSPHDSRYNGGYGLVEIGILKGGNPPSHVCPFQYLDESVKDEIEAKIMALYDSWENYRGDSSIYEQSSLASPGCLTSEEIDG